MLKQEVLRQSKRIEALEMENKILRAENKELRDKLHKKNSSNSSIPPSQDQNRETKHFTRSLRKKSGKKTGGQPNHKGHTLEMKACPDKIIEHKPNHCEKCGDYLKGESELHSTRQVFDIPPIELEVTEHRVYKRVCNCCGHKTTSSYPAGVKSPTSYGKNIQTLVSYMSVRQYISMNRIKEFMSEVFGFSMSEGTVQNILKRYAKNCEWIYGEIHRKLLASHWVGSDETGCRVNGKRHWMWTWQNNKLTYIVASENRGIATIEKHFPEGLPKSILVHDCWRPHFNMDSRGNQICLAHLLRELQYFIEKRSHQWAYQFSQLLCKAIGVKKKMVNGDNFDQSKAISQINQSMDKILKIAISNGDKKLASFQKRMVKYRKHLLVFLDYLEVPFDNNSSERAIRNVKVKSKVSGMFKTQHGAQTFATIRSVIDTCLKNNSSIFKALALVPE